MPTYIFHIVSRSKRWVFSEKCHLDGSNCLLCTCYLHGNQHIPTLYTANVDIFCELSEAEMQPKFTSFSSQTKLSMPDALTFCVSHLSYIICTATLHTYWEGRRRLHRRMNANVTGKWRCLWHFRLFMRTKWREWTCVCVWLKCLNEIENMYIPNRAPHELLNPLFTDLIYRRESETERRIKQTVARGSTCS